ncbi:hypothetical protein H9P43_004411 [Blastocladiella emersonii ATCC 22665]|nr:hypothetical protein H9P43_004411 [Blastocladiella emersonii ATCC 22665]
MASTNSPSRPATDPSPSPTPAVAVPRLSGNPDRLVLDAPPANWTAPDLSRAFGSIITQHPSSVFALCRPGAASNPCSARAEDLLLACGARSCTPQTDAAFVSAKRYAGDATQPVANARAAIRDAESLQLCLRDKCAPHYLAAFSLYCVDLEDPLLLAAGVALVGTPPWIGPSAESVDTALLADYAAYTARAETRKRGIAQTAPAAGSRVGACTLAAPIGAACDAKKLLAAGELPLDAVPAREPLVVTNSGLNAVVLPKQAGLAEPLPLSLPQTYYLPSVTCTANGTLSAITANDGGACALSSECMFGACVDRKCAFGVPKSAFTTADIARAESRAALDGGRTPSITDPTVRSPRGELAAGGAADPALVNVYLIPAALLAAVGVFMLVKRKLADRKFKRLHIPDTVDPGRPWWRRHGPRRRHPLDHRGFHVDAELAASVALGAGHEMLDCYDPDALPRYSMVGFSRRVSMFLGSLGAPSAAADASSAASRSPRVGPSDPTASPRTTGTVASASGSGAPFRPDALAPPVPPLTLPAPPAAAIPDPTEYEPPPVPAILVTAASVHDPDVDVIARMAGFSLPPPPAYDAHRDHAQVDLGTIALDRLQGSSSSLSGAEQAAVSPPPRSPEPVGPARAAIGGERGRGTAAEPIGAADTRVAVDDPAHAAITRRGWRGG